MAAFQYELRMLCILLWKSWRIRKHRKWQTLIEIACPVLLVLLLVSVNAVMEPDAQAPDNGKPTHFNLLTEKDLVRALCTGIGCTNAQKPNKTSILAYAPNNTVSARDLMDQVKTEINSILSPEYSLDFEGFADEQEIEALASSLAKTGRFKGKPSTLTGAVIFVKEPTKTADLVYKIRLMTSRFLTGKVFPDVERAGPGKQYLEYEKSGFLGLQLVMDTEFVKIVNGGVSSGFTVQAQAMTYPPYQRLEKSHYTVVLATLLPSAIILGFVYMVSISIHVIVEERVTGVKKFLSMLGLNHVCYWIGWFLDLFLVALISISLIVMIITTDFSGDGGAIVFTSTSLLWAFLLAYIFAALWFCFFIANLLRSSSHSAGLGAVIWVVTFVIPALLVGTRQRYLATQFLLSICPNLCLYWGFNMIATWESRVIGAQWTNMLDYASATDSLNMASMFAMLIFNGIFYFVLTIVLRPTLVESRKLKNPFLLLYDALYDDTKFPEFINFFRKCCFCCRKKTVEIDDESNGEVKFDSAVGGLREMVMKDLGLVHPPGKDQRTPSLTIPKEERADSTTSNVGVKIKNLTKTFYSDKVLKGFSCDFYANEVSCILGDGGSGKSVMVDILLGILKADEGTAHINDYDIHDYLTEAKMTVGLCPQKTMIFYDLTVMEHLLLFGWLKGKNWDSTVIQAKHVASLLKLKDDLKTPAKKLTKSSQRLLSCAIALMGNPTVIILDEPAQDMDPDSKKNFWNVLLKYKEGRTIVFTSNSIPDASEISDKVAVLCGGRLRCLGSPMFLNSVFGDGYTIKLSVTGSGERLVRMVCQELGGETQVKNRRLTVGGEDITFLVPHQNATMFPKLFYQLYDNKDALNLLTVQIDSLAIEDIFHSVHEMREFRGSEGQVLTTTTAQAEPHVIDPSSSQSAAVSNSSFFVGIKSVGCCLTFIRIWALLLKNYRLSCAKITVFILQVVIPLCLILSGINGANRALRNQDVRHYGQVNIGLENYEKPITLYHIQNPEFQKAFSERIPGSKPTKASTTTSYQLGHEKDLAKYRHQYIAAVEEMNKVITLMYSTIPLNSPPLAVNLVSNAMLKMINAPNQKITVENHPLKSGSTDESTSSSTSDSGTSALLKSFCLYFAYAVALICAMVAILPMLERVSGSHHLQTMTGINPLTFWMSHLILDGLIVASFAGISLGIVFFAQERYLFTIHGGDLALVVILLAGGFSAISFGYFLSQIVNDAASAFGWMNMLHLLAALGSYVMYYIHDGINNGISEIYFWVVSPFPIPVMVHALYVYGKVAVENMACELMSEQSKSGICQKTGLYTNLPAYSCCPKCNTGNCFHPRNYFHASSGDQYPSYTLLRDLVILGILAFVYFTLVVLMDFSYFKKVNRYFLSASSEAFTPDKGDKDPSAAQEAEHVRKLIGLGAEIPQDEGLLVDGFCKNYGKIGIYSQVSFSVKKGECFGLLGLNGSGKSMVFKTLAGEFLPAIGDANIPPYGMLSHRRLFTASIGYCPQENCVFSGLTARETMELYGSLRGICRADLQTEVTQWLSALGLENDANLVCGNYTEGMKRRLCIAVALIGNPRVIILDSPSDHIDPSMKKHIWSTLQRLQGDGKSILLASQNIHECENLCGKVGLMMHGKLQYVGTTKEIKSKFLNGYTVTFKLTKRYSVDDASELETVTELRSNIEGILDDAVYRDAYQNTLKYLIPQKSQNWGSIVERLEKIRTSLSDSVAFYSMTESTLEEVFKAMAELDLDQTNELPGTKVSHFQRCCMGRCCSDDYS